MKRLNFWALKLSSDDYFFELVNHGLKLTHRIFRLTGKFRHMDKNAELKDMYTGRRGVLVANGPSVKNQNLKHLKDEITFFVNRSFLHEDYAYIQPTYHIFVDNKLATGEWDISFLDQVFEKNPNVTFLLNAKWYHLPKFKPYINNEKFKIYWVDMRLFTTPFHRHRRIDLTQITYGAAVAGVAIMGMMYMGMKEIYFLGIDGNGLCYELTEKDSHFYGTNPENKTKTMKDICRDLYMMSLSLKNWCYFNEYAKKIGVNIYNCTDGGIFNMFERKDYLEVFAK